MVVLHALKLSKVDNTGVLMPYESQFELQKKMIYHLWVETIFVLTYFVAFVLFSLVDKTIAEFAQYDLIPSVSR